MMSAVKTAQNPQLLLNQMMQNNPQMKPVMDIINQYGGDPQKAMESVASKYGITAQDIMELLK